MNDTYQVLNTKNNTQKSRRDRHTRNVIEGFEQPIPAGMKWNKFLWNTRTKEEFINILWRLYNLKKVKSYWGHHLFLQLKAKSKSFKTFKTQRMNVTMTWSLHGSFYYSRCINFRNQNLSQILRIFSSFAKVYKRKLLFRSIYKSLCTRKRIA